MAQEQQQTPTRLGLKLPVRVQKQFESHPRVQILGRVGLSLLAIIVDELFLPGPYLFRTLWFFGAFAILVFVSNRADSDAPDLPPIPIASLCAFFALHVLLTVAGMRTSVSADTPERFLLLLKLLLVLPSALLFPIRSTFIKRYLAELVAALVVLLTFVPDRLFHLAWPWYSQVLTRATAYVCSFVVHPTVYDAGALTLSGPAADLIVDFSCSGSTGINLFHLVFALVVIVEWNRLRKIRALGCYVLGGVVYVIVNFLRLILLFLIGNLVSKDLDPDTLGWIMFVITFYILVRLTFDWMMIQDPVTDTKQARAARS